MNFLKGIVDGILSEDLESSNNTKKYLTTTTSQYENYRKSDDDKFINKALEDLSNVYKLERERCKNGLILRYGEGCVQKLSELLKTNHDTIICLKQQLDDHLNCINELNNKLESIAIEQIRLQNIQNETTYKLELTQIENVNLKAKIMEYESNNKNNDKIINMFKGLLESNRSTFENLKCRLSMISRYKDEIDSLRYQLMISEGHIESLKRERDKYWRNNEIVMNNNVINERIIEALELEDRAINIAKYISNNGIYTIEDDIIVDDSIDNKNNFNDTSNDIIELKKKLMNFV